MKVFEKLSARTSDIVKRTIEVSDTEDGTVVVSFHTSNGRGTAPVIVNASEFGSLVSTLAHYAKNGINDSKHSVSDMIHETITVSDGLVSFRTSGGKGSRPTHITESEFSAVVALLTDLTDSVLEAANQIRTKNEEDNSVTSEVTGS